MNKGVYKGRQEEDSLEVIRNSIMVLSIEINTVLYISDPILFRQRLKDQEVFYCTVLCGTG